MNSGGGVVSEAKFGHDLQALNHETTLQARTEVLVWILTSGISRTKGEIFSMYDPLVDTKH